MQVVWVMEAVSNFQFKRWVIHCKLYEVMPMVWVIHASGVWLWMQVVWNLMIYRHHHQRSPLSGLDPSLLAQSSLLCAGPMTSHSSRHIHCTLLPPSCVATLCWRVLPPYPFPLWSHSWRFKPKSYRCSLGQLMFLEGCWMLCDHCCG